MRCACVKPPKMNAMMEFLMPSSMREEMAKMANPETGFMLKCGKCNDPCALRFKPEMKDHDHSGEEDDGVDEEMEFGKG